MDIEGVSCSMKLALPSYPGPTRKFRAPRPPAQHLARHYNMSRMSRPMVSPRPVHYEFFTKGGCAAARLRGCSAARLLRYSAARVRGFSGTPRLRCAVTRLLGSPAARLVGSAATRLLGSRATRLLGLRCCREAE